MDFDVAIEWAERALRDGDLDEAADLIADLFAQWRRCGTGMAKRQTIDRARRLRAAIAQAGACV